MILMSNKGTAAPFRAVRLSCEAGGIAVDIRSLAMMIIVGFSEVVFVGGCRVEAKQKRG
jgi:hypothetical protein